MKKIFKAQTKLGIVFLCLCMMAINATTINATSISENTNEISNEPITEYYELDGIHYKHVLKDHEIITTNLDNNQTDRLVLSNDNLTGILYMHDGNQKKLITKDDGVYLGNMKVFNIETENITVNPKTSYPWKAGSPWGNTWGFVYNRKCSSTYNSKGINIVNSIMGFVPYIGVVANITSLIKAVVGTKPSATVYYSIDEYTTKTLTKLRDRVFVYSDSKYSNYKGYEDSPIRNTLG